MAYASKENRNRANREKRRLYDIESRKQIKEKEVRAMLKAVENKYLTRQHCKDIAKVAKKFEVKEQSPFLPASLSIY